MAQNENAWKQNAATWRNRYPTSELQAEYFLLKFSHNNAVTREAVFKLLDQFKKYDRRVKGELEEHEAMQLLEARNQTKTFVELRRMVQDIDLDQNRELSFLEWGCAIFQKSWKELHAPSVDPEEIRKALELASRAEAALKAAAAEHEAKLAAETDAMKAKDEAERLRVEAEMAKLQLEEDVRKKKEDEARVAREEEEARRAATGQSGVKGAAAKFHYAAKDTVDTTSENAAKLKADAFARREAKRLEEERKIAAEEEKIKTEQAALKAMEREIAEREAEAARIAAEKADAEKRKAEEGSEYTRKQQEAYDAAKRQQEEEERRKKAEEDARRAQGRAKMAEKASLWSNNPK